MRESKSKSQELARLIQEALKSSTCSPEEPGTIIRVRNASEFGMEEGDFQVTALHSAVVVDLFTNGYLPSRRHNLQALAKRREGRYSGNIFHLAAGRHDVGY